MRNFVKRNIKRISYSFWNPKYNIKRGYIHREEVPHYDDTPNKDEWQDKVYSFAKKVFDREDFLNILDIGCGSGFKLFKYFDNNDFTGLELEPTLSYLKTKFPKKKWLSFDEIAAGSSFDLLILSDVIEHVPEPDVFLKEIISKMNFKKMVVSTPERDSARGKSDWGPPRNEFHFREWNFEEFRDFMSTIFIVEDHFITKGKQKTQVLLCRKSNNL